MVFPFNDDVDPNIEYNVKLKPNDKAIPKYKHTHQKRVPMGFINGRPYGGYYYKHVDYEVKEK